MINTCQSLWRRFYYKLWWVQIRELKRDLETVTRRRDELARSLSTVDLEKLKDQRRKMVEELSTDDLNELTFDDKSILDGSFTTILGILGEQSLRLGQTIKENVQLKEKVVSLENELNSIKS